MERQPIYLLHHVYFLSIFNYIYCNIDFANV